MSEERAVAVEKINPIGRRGLPGAGEHGGEEGASFDECGFGYEEYFFADLKLDAGVRWE